jgi:hypothetical protein
MPINDRRMEYCVDKTAPVEKDCPDCIDRYMELTKELHEKLARAISWLQRIEKQYPGSVNPGAIERHLIS